MGMQVADVKVPAKHEVSSCRSYPELHEGIQVDPLCSVVWHVPTVPWLGALWMVQALGMHVGIVSVPALHETLPDGL